MSNAPDFILFDTKDKSTLAEGNDLEEIVDQLELQLGSEDDLDLYDPWGEDR